jgi:hypothetical protein
MRKVLLALSGLAMCGLVAPLTAPAKAEEKVVIKEHRDHPRFVERFHRHDFDRFRHHERGAVIIKKRVREY